MVIARDQVIDIVNRYLLELRNHNIPVEEVILFGSFSQDRATENSDIDIAVISSAFSGDRFDDRRRLVPLRRSVDSRLEPMPFLPEQFAADGILIDEIKRTGIRVTH